MVGAYSEAAPPSESEIPSTGGAAVEQAVGPYQRPDEDLVTQIRAWLREASDAKSATLTKRKRDWAFYGGGDGQWEKEDVEAYTRQKRPRITINLIMGIIAAVEGEEKTNRQEIKYFGQGDDDDGAAEGMNLILKWIMDQCGGQFQLSRQFKRGAASGESWIVPDIDFLDDPEGKIKLCVVKDGEIFDDPLAVEDPIGLGSRYIHRVRMLTDDELEARWAGSKDRLRQGVSANEEGFSETDGKGFRDIYSTPNNPTTLKLYDAKRKLWAVVETWWWQIEPGWVVVDEASQELTEKTDAEFEVLQKQRREEQIGWLRAAANGTLAAQAAAAAPPAGVPSAVADPAMPTAPAMPAMPVPQMPKPIDAIRRPIRRFYQAFTCYDQLLAKSASPLPGLKRFPYVPFRAIYDEDKEEWKGLIRDIIDPQIQHNVEQSTLIAMMQLQPKQGWMAPKGSYVNKAEWAQKVSMPGAMLEYNPSRGKPEPIPAPAIPRHLIDLTITRPQSMRDISGVNVELQGIRQGSDPGVVMEQRTKAAKTVQAPIFDNFRWTKWELGRVLLAYIQAYVPVGRRVRVLGPGSGAQYVTFTENMQLGRFDLAVDETNATINDRVATLNILQTTLPAMMKAGMSITPDFIDLMPMPPHVRDSWKRQVSWEMAVQGRLPPPGWKVGDPVPMPGLPPPPTGGPAPAAAPPQ